MAWVLSKGGGVSSTASEPETALEPSADGKIHVPSADFLCDASFIRSGSDLKLVADDGHTVLLPRYFDSDTPAPLVAPNDTVLNGETVSLLAGPAYPGQYAQIGAPVAASPIGKVERAEGTTSVQHADGTTGSLTVGDSIFEKDVVETGGSLGIRFNDGTVFSLSAGTRMVIDHLVYDPNGSSNSALFSVLKGTFAMMGGNIVDTGDMKVATPIATLGIRGTSLMAYRVQVLEGFIAALSDPNGDVPNISAYDPESQELIGHLEAQFATITRTGISLPTDITALQHAIAESWAARLYADIDPSKYPEPKVTPESAPDVFDHDILRDAHLPPNALQHHELLAQGGPIFSFEALQLLQDVLNDFFQEQAFQEQAAITTIEEPLPPEPVADTIPPGAPTVALANDTGNPGDLLTNDGTLAVTPAEEIGTIQYSTDGGETWSNTAPTYASDGSGSDDGPHTVLVRQVDAAGNPSAATEFAFTLDTVAPGAPTVALANNTGSPEDLLTNDGTLAVTNVEEGATIEYSPDGETWSDAAPTYASDGDQTVYVRQVDAAGNPSAATEFAFTLDTVAPGAPTVALANNTGSPEDLLTNDGTLAVTNVEEGATIEYSPDGETWSDAAPTYASDGDQTVYVRQVDAAGNPSAATEFAFTLDTVAPGAPTVALANNTGSPEDLLTNDGTLAVTNVEEGATIEYSPDGETWSDAAPTYASDGDQTVYVRQVDAAGNPSAATEFAFTLDTVAPGAPTVALANNTGSPEDLLTNDGTLAVTNVEEGATIEYSPDGETWSDAAPTYASDGDQTVYVRQVDAAGNPSAATEFAFTLDTVAPGAPTVALANNTGSPEDLLTNDGTLAVTNVEEGATIEYSPDGETWSDAAPTYASDGDQTVYVRQVDAAGNPSAATEFAFTLDTVAPGAPTVALANNTGSPEDLLTNDGTLAVTNVEEGATIEYSPDGETWSDAAPTYASDGDQTVYVRQVDAAGNPSAATEFAFTLDTVAPGAPTVALANNTGSPEDLLTNDGTLAVTNVEEGATIEYSPDGETWSDAAPTYASDGDQTVYVRQVDAAGNPSAATEFAFTLDTVAPGAPTVALANNTGSPEDLLTNDGTLAVTNVEEGATIEYSPDGETWSDAAPTYASDGDQTVYVRQVDAAGNPSAATEFAFTLDTVAPGAPTVALANNTGSPEDLLTNDGTLAVTNVEEGATIEYSPDGETWSDAAPTYASDGDQTVYVRQVDAAGNPSAATEFAFTLDTVAPGAPTVALANNTGSPEDLLTNDGTLAVTNVEEGATIEYSPDGETWSDAAPTYASDGDQTVYVRQVDAAGNPSAATEFAFTLDTVRPTASIEVDDTALRAGETSPVTFIFSEAVTGLTLEDLTVEGGTLSDPISTDDGLTWTATFTPDEAIEDPSNVITLDNTGVQDAAGNTGLGTTESNTYAIDTLENNVITFKILSAENVNDITVDTPAGDQPRLYAIVGDRDNEFEQGETGFRLGENLESSGGLLNNQTNDDPVKITGSGRTPVQITYSDPDGDGFGYGFGMNDQPGRESTTDSYLNNRKSITFELNEEYFKLNEEYLAKLAKVVFTVNAIGSGANVSLASDGSITDTDLNVSLLNVKDNTSVTINYENETITYVTTTGSTVTLSADPEDIPHYDPATAHFFAEAEANGGASITIGSATTSTADAFAIQDLQLFTSPTAVDPIVLDLGDPGIDLSYAAAFDLNADGQLDNVAWTDGQDGMLVMDLDKSGAIENGTEVFSPDFNQGGYANALEALASLDSNGDGVIDSTDPAFGNLRVWQDQNHDGVSDAGELKTLADLNIDSIDLNATASSGTIDGQQLLAEGTFTYANGQTGDYALVALGQPSTDGTANTAIKLDYSRDTGNRGVIVNLSNSPVQADIGYGIATAAAMTALDTVGNEQALAADVQEVVGTDQADALFAGATGVTFDTRDGNDNLRGSAEADTLIGGAGDDHIAGGGGTDTVDGGAGTDTIFFGDSTSGVSVNLDDAGDAWATPASSASPADGEIGGGFAEGNRLSGIENINGSSHDDVLIGSSSANVLDGGAGNDVLRGEGGDDTLLGGEGNDTLDGGEGNDTLNGGLGNDTLVGGPGNDTIDGGNDSDTVDYSQDGGPHGVIVNLSDQPIAADIGYGVSTVAAMSALDSFGDTDILSGIDNIIGTEFRDVLVGPGNGVTLTGGGGADTFVLTGTTIADLIADYNQSEGDTIDLTALYHEFTAANAVNGTVSASEFISENVQYDQNTGTLSVDMDGDSANGYEQQVATVNEAGSSVSSSLWLEDGISSSDSFSDSSPAPASVTVVVEDQSATTAIA